MHGKRTPTIQSLRNPSIIYKALVSSGWGPKRAGIWPVRWDSHRGRSDDCEFLPRACITRQHCAVDSDTYKPLTRQEAWGVKAPFSSTRVHSIHRGDQTGGRPGSRKEAMPLSIRAPHRHPRPLMALSQQFRSCTGTSVLSVCLGSYSVVSIYAGSASPAVDTIRSCVESRLASLLLDPAASLQYYSLAIALITIAWWQQCGEQGGSCNYQLRTVLISAQRPPAWSHAAEIALQPHATLCRPV